MLFPIDVAVSKGFVISKLSTGGLIGTYLTSRTSLFSSVVTIGTDGAIIGVSGVIIVWFTCGTIGTVGINFGSITFALVNNVFYYFFSIKSLFVIGELLASIKFASFFLKQHHLQQ